MAFNTGDTATGAQAITFKLDILKNGTLTPICINGLSEALNYTVETWYDFCSNGFSSSAVTAIDLEWSGDGVVRYDSPQADLIKRRYNIGDINNIPMEVTNTLLDEVVTVNVSLTSLNITATAAELIKFDFALKPFEGSPVVTPIV